jgi:hypothetical protein
MPVVTVVKAGGDLTAATNRRLDTLLSTKSPITGWVKNLVLRSASANTDAAGGIKVGKSTMTSTDYDNYLLPDESSDTHDGPLMLSTLYVRTDEATDQSLVVTFEMT